MSSAPAYAAGLERLKYRWSLEGGLAWIARIAFPSSGTGTLETREGSSVTSRLTLGSKGGSAYYASSMAPGGIRTFTSEDGYSWNNRYEQHRVQFDYEGRVARVEKRSDDHGVKQKVRALESDTAQDVLTSIYYLRQNAASIKSRHTSTVYSAGKGYLFSFTPSPLTTLRVGGQDVPVRPFTIAPADGQKKGAVKVWLAEDVERTPVRIEIQQSYGTLRLELAT
ncbi:MAG TPA: DUF3108 domain-containing protein [Thermoanaerobaculia bacterium]|nr:DUF3108 domain-containing protein [Thermoanaerobaculia bacterium]